MTARQVFAVFVTIAAVSIVAYGCGLFRFGPNASVWWRHGSNLFDAAIMLAWFVYYMRANR